MTVLCYALTLILIPAAAFLMWFFILGRRGASRQSLSIAAVKADYIISAGLCILMSLIMTFDIRRALVFLESYGEKEILNIVFFPVSALTVCFIMIPGSVINAKKENLIPGVTAVFLSCLYMVLINLLCLCVTGDHSDLYGALSFLVTATICSIIIYTAPMRSRDRYRAELQNIDDMVSEARNAHYEAIKKSSMETRRLRHDMKNHLIALKELASQSRSEELIAYIDSIAEQIEAAAPPYRSGNDIADVIIADKYAKAEKRGPKLCISGDLAGLDIESADLVTILSNLLDNAIEALSRAYGRDLSDEDKKIILEFKKNANFILITEKNKSVSRLTPGNLVSSKNSPDHGFGILNIKRSVKKYGGEFNINCSEQGDIYLVEAEILMPLKE